VSDELEEILPLLHEVVLGIKFVRHSRSSGGEIELDKAGFDALMKLRVMLHGGKP
jgi:hypothetical protein